MSTKIITGTYASGYVLGASYSGISIQGSGLIKSAAGATANVNAEMPGGDAGTALTLPNGGALTNSGRILAGAGGYGAGYKAGAGGVAVAIDGAAAVTNVGSIVGGAGGSGGNYAFYGGASGNGGAGVIITGAASLSNSGLIAGGSGAGYTGDTYNHYGAAGNGGAGVVLQDGGTVANAGTILGGQHGQTYGATAYINHHLTDATAISLSGGGYVYNSQTSSLIEGGIGVVLDGNGGIFNHGTIDGTSGTAIEFGSFGPVLIAYGGSVIKGAVNGNGGFFELDSGVGSISGLGSVTGFSGFAAYDVASGGEWTLDGANTLSGSFLDEGVLINTGAADQVVVITLDDAGVIDNAAGASWTLDNGIALVPGGLGTFVNKGTLTRGTASSVNNIQSDFDNTGTVVVTSGTLKFDGAANSLAGKVMGAGTVGFAGGTTTLASNLALTVGAVSISGATTTVILDETLMWAKPWTQAGGTVSVASGKGLTFTGAADSFTGTLTGAGSVDFAGGADLFKTLTLSAAHQTIASAMVTLEGAILLSGLLSATTTNLIVIATGASLGGGGTLDLSNTASNSVHGASATAKLTNVDDKIEGAGALGGGEMLLINDASASIIGDDTVALVINTGAQTITNAGLIEDSGTGGVTIDSAIANTGTLTAIKGVLTVDGAVTGAGKVVVESGGTADLGSTFSENVTFVVGGGTLELAKSQSYTGTITGFSKASTTTLDLLDIAFGASTKATYSGTTISGTLTVTDGTHTASIKLSGNYTTSTFTVSAAAGGGTLVVDPVEPAAQAAGPPPPHSFVAAMAGMGAGAAGPVMQSPSAWRDAQPMLAPP